MKIAVVINNIPTFKPNFQDVFADVKYLDKYEKLSKEDTYLINEAKKLSDDVSVIILAKNHSEILAKTLQKLGVKNLIFAGGELWRDDVSINIYAEGIKETLAKTFDLIFFSHNDYKQDNLILPSLVGAKMKIPAVTSIISLQLEENHLTLIRKEEAGKRVELKAGLPLIISLIPEKITPEPLFLINDIAEGFIINKPISYLDIKRKTPIEEKLNWTIETKNKASRENSAFATGLTMQERFTNMIEGNVKKTSTKKVKGEAGDTASEIINFLVEKEIIEKVEV